MIPFVDDFLNRTTMYRLVLYVLIGLLVAATILSFFQLLPFNPVSLVLTTLFITAVSWVANAIFANVFEAVTNVESVYITALILALIITPMASIHDIPFLGFAALLSVSSKYILAIGKKHVFNPVAISVVLTSLFLGQSASWWVGTFVMLPFVLVGGFLIVKKTRRLAMVGGFLGVAILVILEASILKNADLTGLFHKILFDSPIIFFASIMLTEPLTTPPKKDLQLAYAAIVGFLFAPQVHLGSFFTTPEIALIAGNVFAYFVSPKEKLVLILREKKQLAQGIYDFVFLPDKRFSYVPGQYLEWTLGHSGIDSRGNRRYFTIASSPMEEGVRLGVRFYDKPSSFKKSLANMNAGDKIIAGQLAGEFVLPKDVNEKCVFIASGIGITPYRSIIKSLLDKREVRPITIFYGNTFASEVVYKDIFDRAEQELGIKTIYTITDTTNIPADWYGKIGYINDAMIKEQVPDYLERRFYISGSHNTVNAVSITLKKMGVAGKNIKTDFFPGLA